MNRAAIRAEKAPAGERKPRSDLNGNRPPIEPGVQVVHAAVPGRLRLFVPGLKRNPSAAGRLEAAASTWAGVHRASASPTTGRLLLEFDPRQASSEKLVEHAARAGEQRLAGAPSPLPQLLGQGPGERAITARSSPLPQLLGEGLGERAAPALPLRTREWEAALGAAALLGAGALLLAVRAHGHTLAFDQAPLALAQEIHSPALTAFMRGASHLAEPAVLWPVTLGATLLGVGRRRPDDFPWLAPVAVGGGVSLIALLKPLLRRARPAAFEHLTSAWGYSLPSGHAFLAAALYGLLAQHGLRWLRARRPDDRAAAAALLITSAAAILLVGISRVYLGVHYPTDVIAGYALALLWLIFLAVLNNRPREPVTT